MPDTASARRGSLLKRTPVRLALSLAVVVAAAYLAAAAFAYELIRLQLVEQQDQRLYEMFSLLSATADPDDAEDLVKAVKTQIAASRARRYVFLLQSDKGAVLAANMPRIALDDGWSTVPPAMLGRHGSSPYRIYFGKAAGATIAVGEDYHELEALRRTIEDTMLWSSVLALVLALGGGTAIALGVQRRLSEIERTMARVAEGDLTARLPVSGKEDDIDQVSQQVNAALRRLAALVEGMRQVSTDIAHDLRTPLNRLRLQISEAQGLVRKGADPQLALDTALRESDRIGATFTALLRIAQIESGLRRSKFGRVDLAELVRMIEEVFADVAEDAGQSLSVEVPAGEIVVQGDAELLTQALVNLVENAIRHCPPGTRIRCAAGQGADGPFLRVADDGPGIPEGERTKVLRRLYRLEASRSTPGSGLGLSLVEAVAALHGARLSLGDGAPGLTVELRFS
ncbi:sensor histidine kinase [Acidimangrovimonas sediminis]|uniref:sensor histidine kinase n=1 Tax=Acidimangrovimonas sediminis TaxID=2056283 RepID=UPI000C7FDE38|nr:ATP-binding protein [Acidimangrovimonas sediminis]